MRLRVGARTPACARNGLTFPLAPGTRTIYEAVTAEGLQRTITEITRDTKEIMGVDTVVVHDNATLDSKPSKIHSTGKPTRLDPTGPIETSTTPATPAAARQRNRAPNSRHCSTNSAPTTTGTDPASLDPCGRRRVVVDGLVERSRLRQETEASTP